MIQDWDAALFLKINALAGSRWDYLCAWPTYLGEAWIALALVWALMRIWTGRQLLPNFSFVAACVLTGGLMVRILKILFDRQRPYTFFYKAADQGIASVHYLFKMEISKSFPSGHAATLLGIAVAIHYLYGKRFWFLYPMTLVLGLTRVYVGAHFPTDVFAGGVIGVLGSLSMIALVKKYRLNVFLGTE